MYVNRLVCQFKLPSSLPRNLVSALLSGASDTRVAFLASQLVSSLQPLMPHATAGLVFSSFLVSNRPRARCTLLPSFRRPCALKLIKKPHKS